MRVIVYPALTKRGVVYYVKVKKFLVITNYLCRWYDDRESIAIASGAALYIPKCYHSVKDAEKDIRRLLGTSQAVEYWSAL